MRSALRNAAKQDGRKLTPLEKAKMRRVKDMCERWRVPQPLVGDNKGAKEQVQPNDVEQGSKRRMTEVVWANFQSAAKLEAA